MHVHMYVLMEWIEVWRKLRVLSRSEWCPWIWIWPKGLKVEFDTDDAKYRAVSGCSASSWKKGTGFYGGYCGTTNHVIDCFCYVLLVNCTESFELVSWQWPCGPKIWYPFGLDLFLRWNQTPCSTLACAWPHKTTSCCPLLLLLTSGRPHGGGVSTHTSCPKCLCSKETTRT